MHELDFAMYYDDDDYSEPVGSCEVCGVNLYEEDDAELCDQCLFMAKMNAAITKATEGGAV